MKGFLAIPAKDASKDAAVKRMTGAILRGDRKAFDRFYDLYVDRLYRYLIVIAPNDEQLVREALQETMIRVLRYMKPFEEEAVLWGWLTRVAKSVLFDLFRRRKRTAGREMPLSENLDAALPCPVEAADDRLMEALRSVLNRLAVSERALVEAHYFDGVSQAALADRMNLSRRSVEGRLARARRKLKRLILEKLDRE